MGTRVVRSIVLLVAAAALFADCGSGTAQTPAKELEAYASHRGGQFEKGTLQGVNSSLLFQIGSLSPAARGLVTSLSVNGVDIGTVPDLKVLPSLRWAQLSRDNIRDIRGLSASAVKTLILSENPISDVTPISSCVDLVYLNLDLTEVERLPDLSMLKNLKQLVLRGTPLRSLAGVETVPVDFELNVMGCDQLTNLDSLLLARVSTLFIDKAEKLKDGSWANAKGPGNYDRLKPWFDAHVDEIKAKRPGFQIKFQIESGE